MKRIEVPIRTYSRTNTRWHWTRRREQASAERQAVHMVWRAELKSWMPTLPCRITLIRIAPHRTDPDNLRGALKSTQDGVADMLGVDDGSQDVVFHHAQRKGPKPRYYAVEILIEPLEAPRRCHACGAVQ